MDVDRVLLSVQERDKWRRRLALLEQTLGEIRGRRARLRARLRQIRRELQTLGSFSDALLAHAHRTVEAARGHAPNAQLPAR